MKKHIISLPHHPKRVIIISLIIALIIGFWGYKNINKIPTNSFSNNQNSSENNLANNQIITLGFLSSGRIKTVSAKVGDLVKNGDILATLEAENTIGALAQAKAAYELAQANYQKVINGATSTAIDVAKTALNTAKINLDGITKQQTLLVANAYQNLLNSTIQALPMSGDNSLNPPTVTGTYLKNKEGDIKISLYQGGSNYYFNAAGLITATGTVSTTVPEPIGDSGLYIQFSNLTSLNDWIISIPNTRAANYLTNYNAYQNALQTKDQAMANAQALVDQANAALATAVSAARPEDVAAAKAQVDSAGGAMSIAEANYENTIIKAPSHGKILSVYITPGQIALPNSPAMQFISLTNTN